MAYIAQSDLEAFLGTSTVLALFDDGNTGTVNATNLGVVIALACARLDGKLARVLNGPFPIAQTPTPEMIKMGALLYAKAFAFQRRPEYVRMYGKQPLEDANAFAEELCEAREFLTDLTAQPTPANNGGVVLDQGARMLTDSDDGTSNVGDF